MKKLALTFAIVLGLGLTSFAGPNDGLFSRGGNAEKGGNGSSYFNGGDRTDPATPALPGHGQTGNQDAPLGSGIAVLTALGAAYLVGKRRKED